jgi:hypothetical protein
MDADSAGVFVDICLEEGRLDRVPQRPPLDLWKVFLCAVLDARVYLRSVMRSAAATIGVEEASS